MNVTLIDAVPSHEPMLQNLFQLYTHDFSEFWAGSSKGNLQTNGRFAEYPLTEYWVKPTWSPSLIECDGVLAGFALVNDHGHSGEQVDRNMAEFFVLRKHRGLGVGRVAAGIIFSKYPGSWEVAVARKNVAALSFWRRTISGATNATDTREIDVSNEHWNGPILCFEWRS